MNNFTLMHEHIHLDLSAVKNDSDCLLNCYEQTVRELKDLKEKGVNRIVEVTNVGIGRNIEYTEKVQQETGIKIVSCTGFYKEPFLPKWVHTGSVEDLSCYMTKEIIEGIEGTNRKADLIGEIGSSLNVFTDTEKKIFRASAITSKETGVVITTHTSLGTLGDIQIKIFKDEEVDLSNVIIGHVDLSGDIDYIRKLLDSGVNVEFDTIGKVSYLSDEIRAKILSDLVHEGYQDQILMSMDITRKSHMKAFGGVGYCFLFDSFIPKLYELGVSDKNIVQILEKNPNRLIGAQE